MTGWRRWGGYLVLTLVFALACGMLSWWQWARRAEAVAEIERIEANYDAEPVPPGELLPTLDAWREDLKWRPVELRGEYLAAEQLLVRNRPRAGAPGFEVLVPFRLDDGRVLIVDRGWLQTGNRQDEPEFVPAPPSGEVRVVARLKPGEPVIPGRTAPPGQVATIRLPDIAARLDGAVYTGAYGLLASEDPAPATAPAPALRPEEDEGPHLSYALQWIAFGLIAIGGLVWAYRRERSIAALPASEREAARHPRRRDADTDAEDAALDAATRA